MKNKIKGLKKSSHIKRLDEICNIGISIPSLEVSPIISDFPKKQNNYNIPKKKFGKENISPIHLKDLKQQNFKVDFPNQNIVQENGIKKSLKGGD